LIPALILGSAMLAGFLALSNSGCPVDSVGATASGDSGEPSFLSDVLPILVAGGCVNCHGDDGGLAVTSVRDLLAGGDSGPAVLPGNADSSNLVRAITIGFPFGPRMPPEGPSLSESSIRTIRAWINDGAKEN
jgi:mono/diheme cytochrome c family protein